MFGMPPEDPDFWKFRIIANVAGGIAVGGVILVAKADLATVGGAALAAAGAAQVVLSLAGFLDYWRSL
jgi:hypothetical protein